MTEADGADAKLLPPSSEPLFPPDLKPGEERLYVPPVLPQIGEGKYFRIYNRTSVGGGDKKLNWINRFSTEGTPPPGYGNGFDMLPGDPIFEDEAEHPRLPDVWSYLSFMIASQRLIDVIRTLDPDAIDVRPIDWRYTGGGRPEQPFYFLDTIRKLPAIDYANSQVRYHNYDGRLTVGRASPWRAMPGLPEDAHIFRDERKTLYIIVSQVLRTAIEKARPEMPSVGFDDIASPGGGL
jgi:hypothetical protein